MFPHRNHLISWIFLVGMAWASCPAWANTTAVGVPAVPAANTTALSGTEMSDARSLSVEVNEIKGVVEVQREGQQDFQAVTGVANLRTGDSIRTLEGSCRLLIDGKAEIRLAPQTTMKISEALRDGTQQQETTRLMLGSGQLMVKLPKLKKGSTFEVNTPTAVATVRGTIFFMKSGLIKGQEGAQLYVDESHGGVDFKNLISGDALLVPAFSFSNAFADGKIEPPLPMTPEQREAFIKNWDKVLSSMSQQFGIEELPASPNPLPPAPEPLLGDQNLPELNDAALDKLAEQNVLGANGFLTPLIPTGGPSFKEENPPTEETTPPSETQQLEQQERAAITEEIQRIIQEQQFDIGDASLAQVADAQSGKTFRDVHGNRVRVDQYIFRPSPERVEFLSLTARTGAYQNGVSTLLFETTFNRPITEGDGALKDLPWNDYMRVVTREQLTVEGSPFVFGETNYDQFIVHEHYQNEVAPDLYPTDFMVALFSPQPTTPAATNYGTMIFTEAYSQPFFAPVDQGNFWVQGLEAEFASISVSNDVITTGYIASSQVRFAAINGDHNVSYSGRSFSQTPDVSGNVHLADLDTPAGISYFANNETHPAFFEDTIAGNRVLIGMFLPVDDQGNVFDAPGFDLRGVRDVVFQNGAVNNGNYNLEMIFAYGTLNDGLFNETFRIDVLVAPEIFREFGAKAPDGSIDDNSVFSTDLNV